MNESPFTKILAIQETAREGWMPEIKGAISGNDLVAELNQRLIERRDSFQAQLIRIEDGWRES